MFILYFLNSVALGFEKIMLSRYLSLNISTKVENDVQGIEMYVLWGLFYRQSPYMALPDGSDGKESACNAGDQGSIPGLERSPGDWDGHTLQYSCLDNSMDRGAQWAQRTGND